METVENQEQFKREAKQMLQSIEEKINHLSHRTGAMNQSNDEEINRLQNQRRNLQEALERYANQNPDNWENVRAEAQYALEEVNNTWMTGSASSAWQDKDQQTEEPTEGGKWRVSTGQSDRGGQDIETGLGDRGGMEDRQFGLDNSTQYSGFGNPYDNDEIHEIEEDKRERRDTQSEERHRQNQGGAADRSDQNNQGRTRRQSNPDDWKTHDDSSSIRSSYDKMRATDRRENESNDQEGLSRTNIGGDATQDDPGGSTDKQEQGGNTTKLRTSDPENDRDQRSGNR